MVFTDRQLKLVQAGAVIIQNYLLLPLDKSVMLINQAIAKEKERSGKEMGEIDQDDEASRKRFIRNVLLLVRKEMKENTGASDGTIKKVLDEYATKIEEIWNEN